MRIRLSILLVFLALPLFGQKFAPSREYIAQNKNKWTVEVPAVQELVHIIIALSPTGMADSNMVEHRTTYYKSVLENFGQYKNHEIVRTINELLRKGLYARIKMDACGFSFGEDNLIVKDRTYRQLNWDNRNYLEPYRKQLEDFARATGFVRFYHSQQTYYDRLIALMKVQMPVDRQWKWLEERFPNRYDNYRITFSPLVNGSHSTNRFETGEFRQTVMFICGPIENPQLADGIKEGLMSRVVFTEIDHNYVNPVSDSYIKEIREIFADRDLWTSGKDSKNYRNPYSVFNEYMTWAVFTLYASDTFEEADFRAINERTELQMTRWRGFVKFREFNQKMLELYRNRKPGETIADLYPHILAWCRLSDSQK